MPDAAIDPVIENRLCANFWSYIGISSSDFKYILSPSVNDTADKSHVCHCPSFSLYCITLFLDISVASLTCIISTVLSPVEVKHK